MSDNLLDEYMDSLSSDEVRASRFLSELKLRAKFDRLEGVEPDVSEMLNDTGTTVNHICDKCGDLLRTIADVEAHPQECVNLDDPNRGVVSEVSDTLTPAQGEDDEQQLDDLVRGASVPSLATLFQRGKDKGLIKPTTNYGEMA